MESSIDVGMASVVMGDFFSRDCSIQVGMGSLTLDGALTGDCDIDCGMGSASLLLNGADVYARSDEELAVFRRREVGLVYQFYNLVPVLNVVENMTLPVALDGRTVNQDRLGGLLDRLGLRGREGHLPRQLSGGQQQRVAIGRALMNAPAVVLADEPTGNLDTANSREIMQLLRDSNRDFGQTMVVITHDEEIALAADRIIAVEDGRIVRDERIRR
jgi:putative ABC transport system ATP-binding protein